LAAIEIITELEAKGVGFRSITENIDTTTSGGREPMGSMGLLFEGEAFQVTIGIH
jgi:DNA invertase Pin-like site-specific DNA recombinase